MEVVVLFNLVMGLILFTPLLETICPLFIAIDSPSKGEVIVVLSAGGYESNTLDYRTLVRLQKGFDLLQNNYAPQLICAGGIFLNEDQSKTIAVLMKEKLQSWGVLSTSILVEDDTDNTYKDISGLLEKFAGDFDFNKAIFVTSAWHTRRVRLILDKKGIQGQVVSADPWELYPRLWTERLDNFYVISREFGALIYFKTMGWI